MPVVKPAVDAKDGDVAKPNATQVQQSLDDINKVLAGFSISVQFKVDPDYKEFIVKVVDQDTGKLIRQIPTEDVVKMSKAMDNLKGLLFAQSV
ncbi:flagellar protein FlaG [Polaromonas sp.]|uniref:flagellar protein FlaG n=1 Tax=Polaromonas sp. TaxID=1869339 RepID=UPI0025EADCA2|nr:flagellar protein FlaG [Polaromonas sp.]